MKIYKKIHSLGKKNCRIEKGFKKEKTLINQGFEMVPTERLELPTH